METIQELLETLPPLRPWPEFVEADRFSIPKTADDVADRIESNINFYGTNYIAIILSVLSFAMISSPLAIAALFGVAAAGMYLYGVKDPLKPVIIAGNRYSDQQAKLFYAIGSFVLLSVSGGFRLMAWVLISFAGCIAHAGCRKRNILNKATRAWNFLTGRRTVSDTIAAELEGEGQTRYGTTSASNSRYHQAAAEIQRRYLKSA